MGRWLEIPLERHPGSKVTTWEEFAERYDRCIGRVAFYVGQRVHDPGTCEHVVTETIESNLDLLVEEQDDLSELRRLRASADRLITTSVGHGPETPGYRS